MIITHQQLVDLGACNSQTSLFLETFGASLELPIDLEAQEKLAEMLVEADFDKSWVEDELLSPDLQSLYSKVTEKAHKIYEKIERLAWADFVNAPIDDDNAWEKYDKIKEPAIKKYNKLCWLSIIQIMTNSLPERP